MNDFSPLKYEITSTVEDGRRYDGKRCTLGDFTVLSTKNDPYRLDTPAGHRDGAWLRSMIDQLRPGHIDGGGQVHLRGLHYMLLGHHKPDGSTYINTDANYEWLVEGPGKCARWLEYLPFNAVRDERNAEPTRFEFLRPDPQAEITVGLDISVPDPDDFAPLIHPQGWHPAQPFRIVMVGEKSSLAEVLAPLAQRYQADLYLPTGECSDTLIHRMVSDAANDDEGGRPLAVLYFSDCDPAGYAMPINVARKLQAHNSAFYVGALDIRLDRVALTPDQVADIGDLPGSPLKAGESRADAWRTAWGIEQTEIDSLAALRPDVLRDMATTALDRYYDHDLAGRVADAEEAWREEAQSRLDAALGPELLAQLRAEAETKLEAIRRTIAELNAAVEIPPGVELPQAVVPGPDPAVGADLPLALLDPRQAWFEQTMRLIAARRYEGDR